MMLNELFRQIKTRKALPVSRQSVENYILTYSRLKELKDLDNYEFSVDGTFIFVFAVPQTSRHNHVLNCTPLGKILMSKKPFS